MDDSAELTEKIVWWFPGDMVDLLGRCDNR